MATVLGMQKQDFITTTTLFLFRLIQLTNVAISCFGVCFLIYMHNHHPCRATYYGCGNSSGQVPIAEVVMVTVCVLVALEFIYSTGTSVVALKLGKRPDSFTNMCTTWISVVVLLMGLVSFASMYEVRQTWPICYNLWPNNSWGPVESSFCIATQSSVTCGLIAWLATVVIAIVSLREFLKDKGIGAIKLVARDEGPATDAVAIGDLEAPEQS